MRTLIASFWMLIMVVGFTNSSFPQTPSATLTSDSLLHDFGLDWAVLTINLSNEMFIDYTSLETSDFVLKNYPPGLSIDSVHGISPTEVDIDLAFDGTDIDVRYYFRIGIRHTVLENTDTLELDTNPLPIYCYIENPVANLTADSILTEQRLEARTLTIDLIEEGFIDYTTLSTASFNLLNAPAGLNIESVQGISPTQAKINLVFNGTDFDTDFLNFRLNISHSVLIQTITGYLATNPLIIHAYLEPEAFMTDDSGRDERRLDFEILFIDLANEMFNDYTSILVSDFVLIKAPVGLSIESIQGISPTSAWINLAFDGRDFDTNYTDFKVGINHSVLMYTKTGLLYTNSLVIHAYVENPVAELSSDSTMYESRLDYRILTINLKEERFLDYTSLLVSDFELVNAPVGLSIESVNGISPAQVVIDLKYTGIDFDVDIPGFRVGIKSSVLEQTQMGVLYTNNLPVIGHVEQAIATLTTDSILTEQSLDERSLTIYLTDEMFLNYMSLMTTDFALINAPTGLTIESVTGISPTQAVLDLAFDQRDFDVTITDVRVQISSHILIQTAAGCLVTNNLTIIPTHEDFFFSISANSINFKEWNYNQRKIVRTPEIGIVAESNNEILFSYDLNVPLKIFDGKNASLAVDKNSNIYIVYEYNGIKYSVKPKSGIWQNSIIISDSSEIGFAPIADCDKDGNVHILYGVKDSCDNGNTYLCSLKYVKVSNDQKQISSIIYDIKDENKGDTLINYTIATDLLFMDKTIFLVYQLSNDSIYVKYSTDSGTSWKMSTAFPGINPALAIGFETFYEGSYDPYYPNTAIYPVILYKDTVGNLINRYAEFYSDQEDFYWENSDRIYDGPIDYLCIDDVIPWNPVKPFGYSNIFQKDSILYHAFSDFNDNYIMDTLTNNAIVSSIAYKQFDPEKVDIIWYEKKGDLYEMYYQWFEKVPPTHPLELLYEYLNSSYVCHGGSSGSIYTFVTGGIPPYHYWLESDSFDYSFIGSQNQYFGSLSAGTYSLTVYDWNFDKMINATFELSEAIVETGEINGPVEVHNSDIVTYSVKDTSVLVYFFPPSYEWIVIGGKILSELGTDSITVQWGSPGIGKISVIEHDDIDFDISCKGESVSLDITIIPTGYNNISILPVNIFPNPFKDKAKIQFPDSQSDSYDLFIMDLFGKVVRVISNINGSSYELNRGDLAEGLYLIELRGPTIYRGKIIIE